VSPASAGLFVASIRAYQYEAMELAESHLILLVLGTALAIMGLLFWLYW
jgi:hypothetical protein